MDTHHPDESQPACSIFQSSVDFGRRIEPHPLQGVKSVVLVFIVMLIIFETVVTIIFIVVAYHASRLDAHTLTSGNGS